MVVKDFLTIKDVKQTVEKPVKEKPHLKDLITVESPGKPTPASFLDSEESEEKPKRKPRKKKSQALDENVSVEKKEATLVITEKPQAAQKIANAIGNPRKLAENNVPYYEIEKDGKIIYVASAVGHLFNLTYKQGSKGWPVFDIEWTPSYNQKSASFTKKYYSVLQKLAKRTSEVIIATDYDIEGEVIGWNVLRFICKTSKAKRMKFSTLTSPELKKAFESPEETINFGNAYAGETRHIIDWLYGINLSRALMSSIKKAGSFKILSIGRVQGPALKIIVEREKEIAAFKPEPYWQVFAKVDTQEYKHPKDIFEKNELEKFQNISEAEAETQNKEERINPPSPFDLTTLQREAYRMYRFSPSSTLQLAQKLYLSGLISYPRTSSQKIPDSIKPKEILKKLAKKFPEAKTATRSKPIEGQKSDPAHPSIYPTGDSGKMNEDENKLYNLIVKRFISCFSPDAKTANRRTILTATSPKTSEKVTFTASGLKIIDKGWTSVYPAILEETEIPDLSGKVKIDEIKNIEKETQPPKRYTPSSLITLLEKKNLGTKTTRSMIVDTLFDRGYLDGKSIQATPLGMKLIDTLEKYSSIIIDENLTKSLEEEMEKISSSSSDFEKKEKEVIEKVKLILTDISKEFKSQEDKIGKALTEGIENLRAQQNEQNELMPCPTCKTGKLRIVFNKALRRYFVGCSSYPNCKQTYSLPPNSLIKNTGNKSENGLPLLMAIRKGKKPWIFPFNPNWKEEQNKKE